MLLDRLRYIQPSDDVAAGMLYVATAILLLCAANFSRRSHRYVRRKAAGQISRINPYLYLHGCKPLSRNEREVFRNLHLAVSPPLNVQFQTAVSAMVTHDPILPPESIGLVRSTFNKLRVDFALYNSRPNGMSPWSGARRPDARHAGTESRGCPAGPDPDGCRHQGRSSALRRGHDRTGAGGAVCGLYPS
jgi:hypothetical protein